MGPTVAVCDAGLPPGLAFLRSLGSHGVRTRAYGHRRYDAGRFSRFSESFAIAADAADVGRFHEWLDEVVERDGIDLVAPTSDYVVYAVAAYDRLNGTNLSGGGHDAVDILRDCLFKHHFARRLDELGFRQPAWAAPLTIDEALSEADRIGYPVVLKPRSHIGIGIARGEVARDETELRSFFVPFDLVSVDHGVEEEHLGIPFMQEQVTGSIEVVSISGYVDRDGCVDGVDVVAKRSQWGGELAVGTWFVSIPEPEYLDAALEVVRAVLPRGIFELELLVDRDTGEYWALEMNPRGFGQMSLTAARGHDLALRWFHDVTGAPHPSAPTPTSPPGQWCMGLPLLTGVVTHSLVGPDRVGAVRTAWDVLRRRRAGAAHAWSDPLPGVAFAARVLRHPGGLVRPFLRK